MEPWSAAGRLEQFDQPAPEAPMWVIVAMNLSFGDTPRVRLVPGPELETEAACVRATRVRGRFDSEKGHGGVEFSFCVPKGSLEIGKPAPEDRFN
jgi:hypothetical protein